MDAHVWFYVHIMRLKDVDGMKNSIVMIRGSLISIGNVALYLALKRTANVQASLRVRAVWPEPLQLTCTIIWLYLEIN